MDTTRIGKGSREVEEQWVRLAPTVVQTQLVEEILLGWLKRGSLSEWLTGHCPVCPACVACVDGGYVHQATPDKVSVDFDVEIPLVE